MSDYYRANGGGIYYYLSHDISNSYAPYLATYSKYYVAGYYYGYYSYMGISQVPGHYVVTQWGHSDSPTKYYTVFWKDTYYEYSWVTGRYLASYVAGL